MLPVQNCHF